MTSVPRKPGLAPPVAVRIGAAVRVESGVEGGARVRGWYMPWQRVRDRQYFYRHRREGGTSRRIYVGAAGSPAAELAAAADDL